MGKVLLTATVQSHICQFHRPLVQMLHEHGYEVHIAAWNNLAEKNGLQLDFADRVYDVPFSRSPKSPENKKAYTELKKILQNERYDFVHCNTPVGGVLTRLCTKKLRKEEKTKVFYTAHGFHFYEGASKTNWLFYYPVEKHFAKLCDKIITINEEDFSLAKEKFACEVYRIHGVGVDESRYHPVDEKKKVEIREKLGLPISAPLILCVGELLPNKNQQLVIKAMKTVVDRFPDAILFLAGNGKNEENLKNTVSAYRLEDHVIFGGYITNLEAYQAACDIAVSCSRREGLGLNLIEAMMAGNPIVATKNRGHNELIHNGKNGWLVEPDQAEQMAEYLTTLISDPSMRERFGKEGIKLAANYSTKRVKTELEEIYFGKLT